MKFLRSFFSFVLLFGFFHHVNADFQVGLDAYNAGEYQEAFQEWKVLAESGEARAQYNIAWMYNYGVGTLKDRSASVDWYKKSAEQGYIHAQYNLGNMYLRADIAEYEEAVYWFRRAAEQGDAPAQYNLGLMYANGKGVSKDICQCRIWIKKASENNDKHIQLLAKTFWEEHGLAELSC